MTRIAVVGNLCNVGLELVMALRNNGFDAHLFVTYHNKKELEGIPNESFVHFLKTDNPFIFLNAPRILSSFDFVNALTLSPIYCQFSSKFFSSHATGSDLREFVFEKGLFPFLLRKAYTKSKRVFFATPELLYSGLKLGIPEDKLVFLPNIVDIKPPKVRKSGKNFRIFLPSRWSWKTKGTDIFLKGFKLFYDKHTDIEIVLVDFSNDSNSEDGKKTLELIDELKLPVKILPKMSKNQLIEQYVKSDVVCDQCTLGVLGLVSFESLACNKPTIGYFDVKYGRAYKGDMPPILNANTPEMVAEVLKKVYSGKVKCNGAKWIVKWHSPERVADIFLGELK